VRAPAVGQQPGLDGAGVGVLAGQAVTLKQHQRERAVEALAVGHAPGARRDVPAQHDYIRRKRIRLKDEVSNDNRKNLHMHNPHIRYFMSVW